MRTVTTSMERREYRGFVMCLMRNLRIGSRERSCRFASAIDSPLRCISSVSSANAVAGVTFYPPISGSYSANEKLTLRNTESSASP